KYFGSPDLDVHPSRLGMKVLLIPAVIGAGWLLNTISGGQVGEGFQPWVRHLGTWLGSFLLVIVAISAASRISRERERQTLDTLLTLPTERAAILFAKWLGSVLCVRGFCWGLVAIWGLGLLTGGLNPCAVVLSGAAWLVYAAFAASVGLWFSAISGSTLRA